MIDSLVLHVESFLTWLVRTTWQASILIGLVLLIQKVLGRRLGVRGCYCLWFLVLLRLALPWTISSGVSVYNLLPPSPVQHYLVPSAPARTGATSGLTRPMSSAETPRPTGVVAGGASKTTFVPRGQWVARHRLEARTILLLALVWLVGVCFLAGCTAASGLRLQRIVRRGRTVTDRRILGLLEDCRHLVGLRAKVRVIETEGVEGPALFGLWRPRLLLPRARLAEGNPTELRHIFLHELAHLKRHDILIGHLASLLHIFHWFNPLIALGFRRMQADRELACDGLALSVLEPEEAPAYGRTIVHQIEQLLTSQPRWVLAALGGDRAQIKRRIAMIAESSPRQSYHWSPFALALVGVLAWAGLTNGFASRMTWDEYARRDWPTTCRDRHANIQRACIRNMATGKYLVVQGDKVACDADEPGYAGLWEFRFDEVSNDAKSDMYFYSVAAQGYLTTDQKGSLSISARAPEEAASWGTWPRPQGVFVISRHFKDGYLRLDEQGEVHAENMGRDAYGYWDIHTVWRVKTSDDPRSHPEWQREHVPGPD